VKQVISLQVIELAIAILIVTIACHANWDSVTTRSTLSNTAENSNCRAIQHIMGTTKICGQPQRIAVLGPNALEPLLALGIQPMAFADHIVYHQGDYTNPRQQIPYLGQFVQHSLINLGSAYMPSIERIFKFQPDLILGTEGNDASQYQLLSKVAPTVILTWEDSDVNLRTVAQIFDRSQQAEKLLIQSNQRVETARNQFASLVAKTPKILLLSSTAERQVYLLGKYGHGLCGSLIEKLGFQLVEPPGLQAPRLGTLVSISLESLPDLNQAERIILLGHSVGKIDRQIRFEDHQLVNDKQAWRKNAITQKLTATQNGQVYFIPAYLCLGLSGPIGTEIYLDELKEQLLSPQQH
jgi:iron complex transport system substrate-binding protein